MTPLAGIRVVDFSHAISGPTCTQMLAQLGAEVIKIEPPRVGDAFRHYTEHAGLPLMSIPFAAINAGKRSLTADLKSEEGREIVWKLIDRADVLVENFRPGVLERLGFGRAALDARKPGLVSVSVSGFGQTGPLRDWGAYDHIAQAMSGLSMLNAEGDGPRKLGMPIVDSFSGYLAVIAVLAALRSRDATGKGEHVDVAMLDAALKLVATSVTIHSHTGEVPKGTGNRGYRLVATAEFYPTGDGWIALGANQQHHVEALLRVLGHPELIADPRFADHAARVRHYDAVRAWLVEVLAGETAADLEPRLTAAGVPAAMIRDIGQIAVHPQLAARGLLQEAILPGFDAPLAVVGPGFAVDRPAAPPVVPTLGGDTDAVLAELGYDAGAIARLRAAGSI
ncbi:CoA transferase [Sphingomonas naphthae]|uniref:CoA transferase n=1 Tax=Sphingomonas naphthae TaxID=1813468 RepID=A0ABY7TGR4_9SPHN|nr:CoA transferase [Sphingomonas naphthae]WCT72412.1 CoA transferase [Sphingomonas naphthae]